MSLGPRGVLALVVVLATLGACRGGDDTTGALQPGDLYVALGDSYTAAPANGPPAAKDGCIRTTANYPHQVAERMDLKLTDVSCSGAMTEHVTRTQELGLVSRPPQIDAVSRETDLVTIGLGANDFNLFAGVAFACTRSRGADPTGSPCTTANAAAGAHSIERRIPQVQRRIAAVIRLVQRRAPKARIVVVGYPQIFPTAGPCEELPLADGDFPLARRFNELLVGAQKRAAAQTKVQYLDVFAATKGHDICAEEPWIAGAKPARPDAMFYHPYPEEQDAIADLLVGLLVSQR